MKKHGIPVFTRISILIFSLITILSLIFVAITYFSATRFYQASTQLLNKDVAAHIAKFASPFEPTRFNREKADSVFYNAMVISPSIEVYFLDTTGNVIYYHAPDSAIRQWKLPLQNIRKHIASNGQDYITGPDPRNPENPKIFSAAEVVYQSRKIGYIYVVLGSNEYRDVMDMFFKSQIGTLMVEMVATIVIFSLAMSILYVNRLRRKFNRVIHVLEQYQQGNLTVRFGTEKHDEFTPITRAFDRMADLLLLNFEKLKKSEKERMDFVANVSHDLRTPLAIARGFTETMLVKMDEQAINAEEQEAYTQKVLRNIVQIETMVKQLFELSRMDSVEFRPAKEPFILSEILQEMISNSNAAAAEKQLRIDCIHCEDTSLIYADIRLMERVIQNLLDNAIKYTPQNGRIRIFMDRKPGTLVVQFENTGRALDKDLTEWINDASSARTNQIRPSTSGLGLAIVKRILELHGYRFAANTGTGLGNQFVACMNVYDPDNPSPQK